MAFLFVMPTWPVDVWTEAMHKVAPELDVRVWPGRIGNRNDIEYCAAWLPPPGILKSLPNLKVIMSLGAGVDAILQDATLPGHLPIVRVNDPDLTGRMTEYVVLHVLMHHRQQRRLDRNQKMYIWDSFPTHAASDLRIGIMGMGVMGTDSSIRLRDLGFRVAGWSRSRKNLQRIFSALKRDGVTPGRVWALPQPDWSRAPTAEAFGAPDALHAQIVRYNAILAEEVQAFGGKYVDLFPLMKQRAICNDRSGSAAISNCRIRSSIFL